MRLQLGQRDIVNTFIARVRDNATSFKSGTYNGYDPTRFERATASFYLAYGFSFGYTLDYEGEIMMDLNNQPVTNAWPDPETVVVEYEDCTWGVEFCFKTSIGELKGYWSRSNNSEGGEWRNIDVNFERAFKMLLDAPAEKRSYSNFSEINSEIYV